MKKVRRPLLAAVAVLSAVSLAGCGTTVRGAHSGSSLTGEPRGQVSGGSTAGQGGQLPTAEGVGPATPTTRTPTTQQPAGSPVDLGSVVAPHAPSLKPGAPIQVGVLMFDNNAVAQSVGLNGFTNQIRDAIHALIKAVNAAGGVAGHRLVPVDATVNAQSQNYNSDFEAACQTFTRDNHVAAVIDDGLFYHAQFNACLNRAGVPLLVLNGPNEAPIGDSTDQRANPGLIAVNSPNADRKLMSILNNALRAGYLKPGSKLGVMVETCPFNIRPFERVVKPIAARARVTLHRHDTACLQDGFGQAGRLASDIQSAVLKFRSEGVDSVMFVSVMEQNFTYFFSQYAQSQRWAPQYLVFFTGGGTSSSSSTSSEQFARMRGFGGIPTKDVTEAPAPTPAQAAVRRTCVSMAKGQGLAVATTADQEIVWAVCDGVLLLRSALTNSGGRIGLEPIVSGIEQLGTSFVSAQTINGATRFGPGRHDGMELTAVSGYVSSCSCWKYVSSPRPI